MHALTVIRTYLKLGVLNVLQYRVNFLFEVLSVGLYLTTSLLSLAVIFGQTATLRGWTRDQLVALVGIHTRGVPLAARLRRLIEERSGTRVGFGALDVTFHRDDVLVRAGDAPLRPQPLVRTTRLPSPLEGRTCVLVDDVLSTGRTSRAAVEALFGYGRPARVQLAVLADRGHRELPIRPDYVGKSLPTSRSERVSVQLVEVDEVDRVLLVPAPEEEES